MCLLILKGLRTESHSTYRETHVTAACGLGGLGAWSLRRRGGETWLIALISFWFSIMAKLENQAGDKISTENYAQGGHNHPQYGYEKQNELFICTEKQN